MRPLTFIFATLTALPAVADEGFPRLEIHGLIDIRAVQTDDQPGWRDNGLGKTRFGGKRGDGDRLTGGLGEASLLLRPQFGWDSGGHLHLKFEKDQKSTVDIVEAFATYRPASTSPWRFSLKAGSFFPPVSLENVDIAWQSPYTISWSAINSWIGEEVRSTGAEFNGRYRYDGGGVTIGGALFAGNDPAGTILHQRGWALHDRTTALFDNIPLPATTADFRNRGDIEPFKEIDDTPGLYLTLRADDEDLGGEFLLTAYDNFADEGATRRGRGAWRTRFISSGFSYFLPFDIEMLTQFMHGDTERQAPTGNILDASFTAAYLLLSGFVDEDELHRLSLRYDWFRVDDQNIRPGSGTPIDEIGNAWTFAYTYRPDEHHRISLEFLSVASTRAARLTTGVSARQRDNTIQTSYRFTF